MLTILAFPLCLYAFSNLLFIPYIFSSLSLFFFICNLSRDVFLFFSVGIVLKLCSSVIGAENIIITIFFLLLFLHFISNCFEMHLRISLYFNLDAFYLSFAFSKEYLLRIYLIINFISPKHFLSFNRYISEPFPQR